MARADNLYRGYLDYDGALAELEIAAKTLPNDARVFELKGYIQRRQGKQEEAVRSLERAVDLDPRNSFTLQQIALSYRNLRHFAEKNRFWIVRWLSSRMMLFSNLSARLSNSIGKLIPARCIKCSIQFGPQIPQLEPLPTIATIGFFAHWPNAMLLPQKMP